MHFVDMCGFVRWVGGRRCDPLPYTELISSAGGVSGLLLLRSFRGRLNAALARNETR